MISELRWDKPGRDNFKAHEQRVYAPVLGGAAKFLPLCGIPEKLITFNPMQYVKLRGRKQETDIFSDSEEDTASIPTITHEQFQKLEEFLKAKIIPLCCLCR